MSIHDKTLAATGRRELALAPGEELKIWRSIRTRCGMRAGVPAVVDLDALYGPLPVDPTVQPARLP